MSMKVKIINGHALYDPDLIGQIIESVLYVSCMSKPSVLFYILLYPCLNVSIGDPMLLQHCQSLTGRFDCGCVSSINS